MLTTTISFIDFPTRRVLMSYEVNGIIACPFKKDQGLTVDGYGKVNVNCVLTTAYPAMLAHRVIVENKDLVTPNLISTNSTERTDITVG